METIKHFSHKHPLILYELNESENLFCSACQKWCEGRTYCCDACYLPYLIHESCAELPAEIQHFYHSSHSLVLHGIEDDMAVNCDVCQQSWLGFTYRCNECDFKIDVQCAKLLPEIQLSIHPDHPLTLQVGDTETESHFFCDFCNNRCYSDRGCIFSCKLCKFKIDLDCARMLLNSKQIQHVSHDHWLTLDMIRLSDSNKYCSVCRQVCSLDTYVCKRCYFFLHKSCAEYPTEIQLSLHSDHPLTLHTGTTKVRERCDFCNLLCQGSRGFTFRCDMCNFKIDFSCARMLIEFPESCYINHFSHPHSLILDTNKLKDDAYCYACKKPLSSPFYRCESQCDFYLHKSCSISSIQHYRDYNHIQNSSHKHPLAIVYYNRLDLIERYDVGVVCCSVCGKLCDGPTYVCFLCKVYLHESCLDLLQTICQNSFHMHPLIIIQKNLNDSASCSACGEICLDQTFICLTCKFYFHEPCLQLPQKIQHFFHPCPLTLRQKTTKFTCRACEKIRTQFAFYCNKCHFYLDVECALMFTQNFEGQNFILNPSHGHPLILCYKEMNDQKCVGCNRNVSGQIYGCIQCDFYLHRSCAAAPQKIKHPFHPNHTLTLTYGEKSWCTVSILKTLDARGEMKYLRHKHFSIVGDKNNEVFCGVCDQNRICGPSYDCSRCNFFIHQDCPERAEEVQYPSHPHDFLNIGISRKTPPKTNFKCDACHYRCAGFSYSCDECDFELDAQCASLMPSLKYKDKHRLTFFEKMYDDPECEVCKSSYPNASYLGCVECDFNVHFLCVPLPCTIKHKCHIDPLYLEDYFVEDDGDSDEYYCDACEETRDPRECVYHCAQCSNYVAHVNCVIDEVLLSLSRKRGDVEREDVDFRFVDRQMADKQSKTGLTLEYFFNPSNENEQKEFKQDVEAAFSQKKDVEAAIDEFIWEVKARVNYMNKDSILEDLAYSEKTSNHLCDLVRKEHSEMTFWELKSEVVKIKNHMVSPNFAFIVKTLFDKYGDITVSANPTLNPLTKTRFLNIFCGVAHSMCNTKVKDITWNLLFNWWKNFKLVQDHAGFDIQFALDHLHRLVQGHFRVVHEFETDRTLFESQNKIEDLTTKLEELKVEQKQYIKSKRRLSVKEKELLTQDMVSRLKTGRKGLL